MAAVKRFPNENAEETRRAHIEYLEDKKKEFTKLLLTLKKEKDELEADEAGLVDGHAWAARQKETLTRDFENILEEELRAMHAQVRKTPQEVEAELNGGEPDLQTRFEFFRESKRKIPVSLMDVEDEEIDNVDEEQQLRTKREELTRRTKEAEEKLANVEKVLLQVNQAMKEQEADQSTRKEQVAAPHVGHDGSTRKRKATGAGEERQPKKAEIMRGLEEEEPEDEEEEYVRQREEPGRKEKPTATNERDAVQKSTNIRLNSNDPVQAEEGSREKDVNASKHPAAAGPAGQQSATSKQSSSRGDRQPTSAGKRITLDELKQVVANIDFQRDDDNKICIACPYYEARKNIRGYPKNIFNHFITHLRTEDRPYRCSQNESHKPTTNVTDMRRHFETRHKELTWNDAIAKQCEVLPNKERLKAIKGLMLERTGRFGEKLTFDQLEEQVRNSTLTRNANGVNVFKCSACGEVVMAKAECGRPVLVGQHLKAHLAPDCLPYACPAGGCDHVTTRHAHLKDHFQSAHEKLEWTAQEEEKSVVTENVKRLEKIVRAVIAANPDERGLALNDVKAQSGNITFTRNANGVLRMNCSMCTEQISVSQSDNIRFHLVSHLRHSSQPLRCPEHECHHMTGRLEPLRKHLHSVHGGKELTKAMEKDCEVPDNKKQLDAIVASVFSRRP